MTASLPAQPFVILVGFDFSLLAVEALDAARTFARRLPDAEVHALYVARPSPTLFATSAEEGLFRLRNDLRARGLARTVVPHSIAGDARIVLVTAARFLRADLLVVGAPEATSQGFVGRGSVAEEAMLHAPCAVYAVRRTGDAIQECNSTLRGRKADSASVRRVFELA